MKSILVLLMVACFPALGVGQTAKTLEDKLLQLSDLEKAIELDENNSDALRLLTILSFDEEVGAKARKIYDPLKDEDRSFRIDCELGYGCLNRKKYKQAVQHFERAYKENQGGDIRFGLAKALLLSGQDVDEARMSELLNFAPHRLTRKTRKEIVGSFFEVRGLYLKKLKRFEEAAAAFEVAFRNYPEDEEIIKQLIEVYMGRNDRQAEAYRRRLKKLHQKNAED